MVLSTYIPLISGMAHRGAGRYRSHRVAGPAVSRVRARFSHDRVDDLESLSRHGLHHLVVPHPPSLSARRSFSEHVACADEGVAAEYRRVIDLYVAAALGGGSASRRCRACCPPARSSSRSTSPSCSRGRP